MKKILLSLLLGLALLLNTVTTFAISEQPSDSENLIELTDKRERYCRHFLNEDGTASSYTYPEPVNFLKDGQWMQIDNTLERVGDAYRNKSNEFTAEFAVKNQEENLVVLKQGKYEISWTVNSDRQAPNGEAKVEKGNSEASPLSITTHSRILYSDIFEDTDIRYTVSSSKVQEYILLKSRSACSCISFPIYCKDLRAKLEEDNSVSFLDPDSKGEPVFVMEAPFMYDSSESPDISYSIEVTLEDTSSGYLLTYTPDKNWLDSPERVYPVVIDPTTSLYSARSSSAIADTYIHSGDSAGEHTLLDYVRVGNAPDGLTRSFIKTSLPSITDGTVYSAKLLLYNTGGSSTFGNVSVYRVDTSWSSFSLTWSSHYNLSNTLIKSNIPVSYYYNYPSTYRYVCDVTDTVQDFYKGTRTNYGFMVRYTNEDFPDYNAFYSSDCGMSNVMPCLYISYAYGQTNGITSGGIYYIKNKRSGKYLDVSGAGTSNGTDVIQWQFHGGINQQWKAIYAGNGLYRFQAMNTTDKYLEVESYTNADEIDVDISNVSLSRQLWSIQSNGNSSYRILSECSNLTKGVTVEEASYSSGADVFQYTYTGSGSAENDDWVFEKINSVLFPRISSLHQCARNYNSDLDISNMLLFQFLRSANPSYTNST